MANPEHLEILKQGVEAWNRWRKENRAVRPELRGADLRRMNLVSANLGGANLTNANLKGADLGGSYLRSALLGSADLSGSHLGGANLAGAFLQDAKLVQSTLIRAHLGNAHLESADLWNADLGNADLRAARLNNTNIARVKLFSTSLGSLDLSAPKGIEEALHFGPSTVGTDSLELTAFSLSKNPSKQRDIENFLRGTGVSEYLIDYFRSLVGHPVQFYTSFISYNHSDRCFAHRLHDQLQARGFRCWLDEHDMKPGDRILDVVNDAIRVHDKILLCCSETSLNSWWVKDEIRKAQEKERSGGRDIIIPLMIDHYLLDGWEDGMAADLRSRLAADFTGWEHDNSKFEEQFERVVKALQADERAGKTSPRENL